MGKYIDPTYDLGFKLLFGRENLSNVLLIGLLNALLEGDPELRGINSIKYLNSEKPAEWKDGKGIRYDLLCQTDTGKRFIVEMQKAPQAYFLNRSTFYVCRDIAQQGYRGKDEEDVAWDYDLTPVIGVFICNFRMRELEPKVITRVRPMDEETHKPVDDKVRYIYIQLPLFDREEDECDSIIDQWLYNIKNMGPNQEVAFISQNDVFKRLKDLASKAMLTPEERNTYEAYVRNERDRINQERYRLQEALEEGKAIGIAKGEAIGITKGIAKEKRENARNLKILGIPVEIIVKATGLSASEIEQL